MIQTSKQKNVTMILFDIKNKIISQIELNIPTFTKENLPKELSTIDPVKPGSRNL